MSIKGIIFDFDGTLFDSMGIWETAGSDYLASLGRTAEEGLSETLKTMSMEQAAEYLKAQYALPFSIEEIQAGINKTIEDFYFHRAEPKEQVRPALELLKTRGIKMCIATATDRHQVEAALKRCHLLDYFSAIFTCSEVGHGKEEPHIFECARRFMGTEKAETAVFEDAYHAARTAKAAGFFVVGIHDQYERQTEELKKMADGYVSSFSEIEKLLHI